MGEIPSSGGNVGRDGVELAVEHDAGGPGRPARRAVRTDGGDGDETESPFTYNRDDGNGAYEKLRPGISKVERETAECPTCSGQLVHVPARDPVNPYDGRSMIMCAECFRGVLVESVSDDDSDETTTGFPASEPEADDENGQSTLPGEPEGPKPDSNYSRERGGFVGYGWTGPHGVRQRDLFDFETDEDDEDPTVRADGGRVVRRDETEGSNEPGDDNVETRLTRTDTGVRIKTEIQRGSGTNDRDKVTGEVKRESLSEAADELMALESLLRGHLAEVRGWDENGQNGDEGGEGE